MLSLIFLALLAFVGFSAYKAYGDNGNSISPLDVYFAAVVKRIQFWK